MNRKGFDYFPLSVDFYDDDKITLMMAVYGITGAYITIRLLAKIYKDNGYYLEWNEDIAKVFATRVNIGDKQITHSLVIDIVNELVKRDFFDKVIFNRFSVLTSRGIQTRYAKICKQARRKDWEILSKYNLSEEEADFSEEKAIFSEKISKSVVEEIQSKVKESKVLISLSKELEEDLISEDQFYQFLNFYCWLEKNAKKLLRFDEPLTALQYSRLLNDGYDAKHIKKKCQDLHNYSKSAKYTSVNLTIRKWMNKDLEKQQDEAANNNTKGSQGRGYTASATKNRAKGAGVKDLLKLADSRNSDTEKPT